MPRIRAEILSIGTELLLGQIVDTNAAYLARRLAALGIDLFHISEVGDNLRRATAAVGVALSRADLLVCTGGLGPTEDDLTREAIAAALQQVPAVDPALEAELRQWFAGRGLSMPERNVKQAWLIPSARAIPNPLGTAPGWWVHDSGKEIVAMPGVPREMTSMWEGRVEPELAARGTPLVVRTLKVLGIGESAVEELLAELVRADFPTVATYAKNDGVHVRIAAKSEDRGQAAEAVARVERVARERLGDHIWGVDDDVLLDVIAAQLRRRGWTLAIRETASGGLVSAALCARGVPEWFAGGVIGPLDPPSADVRLDVSGTDGAIEILARGPNGERTARAVASSLAEAQRRAVITSLDALRRLLSD
ncbi:MAG: CinA family nicotinamide mononucleotide deamidase-related protein [Chloroflexi bacterium]|nr:MAG: CinA family nicotinamide mononucleotide deamidase-related protein [Chloroflexota bacterium]TMD57232.1 MAG: CinA family nicotinamide mononucleotide deamidase-related protein [Chloroflexota bacterium]